MDNHTPEVVDHKGGQVLADHDLLGDTADVSHEEATHIGQLTEEEKVSLHLSASRKVPSATKQTAAFVFALRWALQA